MKKRVIFWKNNNIHGQSIVSMPLYTSPLLAYLENASKLWKTTKCVQWNRREPLSVKMFGFGGAREAALKFQIGRWILWHIAGNASSRQEFWQK